MSDRDRWPVEDTKDDSLSGTILDFTITYLRYINRGQKYRISPHMYVTIFTYDTPLPCAVVFHYCVEIVCGYIYEPET